MVAPVREGEVLAGKYRVERVLGQGGMGVVVAARHVELDERVALKFLLPDAAAEPQAVARFMREARAAVRIKSERVARVYDVGQLETGTPYIVMEFLEGVDLGGVLRSRGVLELDDAVDYLAQACEAVAEAHVLGIVHRDLKPSNFMLVARSDGSSIVKVLDFGISKIAAAPGQASALAMTRTAAVLGSPLYVSPEQMMSPRDVDARTDIWALGTVLYELLAGKPPFMADTLQALGVLIATAEPVPMRAYRLDVPSGVEAIILRCLAKRPADRFENVGQLAQSLVPFAPQRSLASIERCTRILRLPESRPEPPRNARSSRDPAAMTPDHFKTVTAGRFHNSAFGWGQTASRGLGRRKVAAVAGGAVVLSLVGIFTLLGVLRFRTQPTATSAAPAQSVLAPPAVSPTTPPAQVPLEPVEVQTPVPSPAAPASVAPRPTRPAPRTSPAAATTARQASSPTLSPPLSQTAKSAPPPPKKSAYDDM